MDSNQSIQQLSEGLRVSIRDKQRVERRRMLISNLTTTSDIQDQQLKSLRATIQTQGDILKHITLLKFISIKPEVMEEFMPLANQLIKLALQTRDQSVFKQIMHVLTNMAVSDKFDVDDESIQRIVKQGFDYEKMGAVQQLIGNLIQRPNQRIMNIIVPAGILQLVATRFKLLFANQDDEISFLMIVCGLLINSRSLPKPLKTEIVQIINTMEISNKEERDWNIITSLSECGFDPVTNKLIFTSKLYELITNVLASKSSKYIIHILRFILNMSTQKDGCELLESCDLFQKLLVTWENRHPLIKPMIVDIIVSFVRVQNKDYADKKLFHQAFSCFKKFETLSGGFQFELGRLALALLKLSSGSAEKWVTPLVNFNILFALKVMMGSENKSMILLGIETLGTILQLDDSHVSKCKHLQIDEDLQGLMYNQLEMICKWAKVVIDNFFKN